MNEAHSIFGEGADKLSKVLSTNDIATGILLNALHARIKSHEAQYAKVCDGLVMDGDTRVVLVRAAHIRGELANTRFILEELQGLINYGDEQNR